MGFYGQAAAFKLYIIKCSTRHMTVQHTNELQSSEDDFSGVKNHDSPSRNLTDKSEFGGCQENMSDWIGTNLKFGEGVITVWARFSGTWLVP